MARTSGWALLGASIFVVACGGGRTAMPEDLGPVLGCSPTTLDACTYAPATLATPSKKTATHTLSYVDRVGRDRQFTVEIRRPEGTLAAAPVVIWSHGGAGGIVDPSGVGNEIGETFLAAGFVSIFIAHAPRSADSYRALCTDLGLSDAACAAPACSATTPCAAGECEAGYCSAFKYLHWDRPHDLAAVLDWLDDAAGPGGEYAGVIDLGRIVYAGHSAGAGAAEVVAGAARNIGAERVVLLDPRPIAFLSASNEGPGDDGLTEASFAATECLAAFGATAPCLSRPHLFVSGRGDDTGDTIAEGRRASFDLVPAGDKYRLWIDDEAARHSTFEHKTDACTTWIAQNGGDVARCSTFIAWQRSAIFAFLDAYVRELPAAKAYLASDNLATLSAGVIEWSRK